MAVLQQEGVQISIFIEIRHHEKEVASVVVLVDEGVGPLDQILARDLLSVDHVSEPVATNVYLLDGEDTLTLLVGHWLNDGHLAGHLGANKGLVSIALVVGIVSLLGRLGIHTDEGCVILF